MNKDLICFEKTDLENTIEKKFKKYTLEVDDAIEAHGFNFATYIDYAEDSIFELQDSIKKHFKNYGSSLLFTNLLETSLNETVNNIANYTLEDALTRRTNYTSEKLKEKVFNLHEDLKFINTRLLNSFKSLE